MSNAKHYEWEAFSARERVLLSESLIMHIMDIKSPVKSMVSDTFVLISRTNFQKRKKCLP